MGINIREVTPIHTIIYSTLCTLLFFISIWVFSETKEELSNIEAALDVASWFFFKNWAIATAAFTFGTIVQSHAK